MAGLDAGDPGRVCESAVCGDGKLAGVDAADAQAGYQRALEVGDVAALLRRPADDELAVNVGVL